MTGINVIIADTDEETEKLSPSFIKMIIGIFTGNRGYMQPPEAMTTNLKEASQHPDIQQMLKYSFISCKQNVKKQVKEFLSLTNANELIAAINIYDINDRIKSYKLFAEINEE